MSEANEFPVGSRIRLLTGNSLVVGRNLSDVIIRFIVINKIRLLSIGKYFPLGPNLCHHEHVFLSVYGESVGGETNFLLTILLGICWIERRAGSFYFILSLFF